MKAQQTTKPTKGEMTAQRIMDAAEKLFARQGYQATTLRDIAEDAGLREPGIYNHFANKEALYAAVLERSLRPMEQRIARLLEAPITPAEALALPGEILRLNAEHPQMPALFYQAIQAFHEGSPAGNAAEWMLRLFAQGRALNRQVMPGDDDSVVLQGIAIFNLCCGYFLAQPLLRELAGIDALSDDALEKQQRLMERVMRAFLIG
ncbi:MAG: helix-turn-helix domain containing protein [Novosphingobium sp.]|nr:helix-turn-helix domain containing protein [Novosphingobium sp.]